jgi:hypothetical protein
MFRPFFPAASTVTGVVYLDTFKEFLMSSVEEEGFSRTVRPRIFYIAVRVGLL